MYQYMSNVSLLSVCTYKYSIFLSSFPSLPTIQFLTSCSMTVGRPGNEASIYMVHARFTHYMSDTYPECDVHTLSVKVRMRPLASSTTTLRKYNNLHIHV